MYMYISLSLYIYIYTLYIYVSICIYVYITTIYIYIYIYIYREREISWTPLRKHELIKFYVSRIYTKIRITYIDSNHCFQDSVYISIAIIALERCLCPRQDARARVSGEKQNNKLYVSRIEGHDNRLMTS